MSRDEQMKTPEQQARESDRLCLCCYMAPARDLKSVCKGCEEALLGQSRPYGTTKERWEGAAAYASSVPTQYGNYSIGQIQDATVAGHTQGRIDGARDERERIWPILERMFADQNVLCLGIKNVIFGQVDTGGEKV